MGIAVVVEAHILAHFALLFICCNKQKGRKELSTRTVNRVYSSRWKHIRLFYLAPRWRQNRNWGRAWLVNVKSWIPGQLENIFSLPGTECLCLHKQQWWWHHWLGNMQLKLKLMRLPPPIQSHAKTNIYFQSFYNSTLMKAWDRGSTLLEPYLSFMSSRCWRDQMVANHLSNHCLTHMRSGCR